MGTRIVDPRNRNRYDSRSNEENYRDRPNHYYPAEKRVGLSFGIVKINALPLTAGFFRLGFLFVLEFQVRS